MIEVTYRGEPVTKEMWDEPYNICGRETTVGNTCLVAMVLLGTKVLFLMEAGEPLKPEDTYVVVK